SLFNFQQMIMDFTGLEVANASLLDEATAAAEAMALAKRVSKSKSNRFVVSAAVHPQTIEVIKTRAKYFGFDVEIVDLLEGEPTDCFGALLQYPGTEGNIDNLGPLVESLKQQETIVCVACDLLSLALLKPPGEFGVDIAIGNAQRFGVPMGMGGPHAAFFATKDAFKRSLPGRVIGVSKDVRGNRAFRMAMQTREQHIRRDKATSNICTAQALLANMSAFYAVFHGPDGIKKIADRVHQLTCCLAKVIRDAGYEIVHNHFFDTIVVRSESSDRLIQSAIDRQINLRRMSDTLVGISLDETTTVADLENLVSVFESSATFAVIETQTAIPASLIRESEFLQHPTFNSYRSETDILRYMKSLENRDYSLVHGMIPLGSCTMKLNATTEMIPVTWPEFANVHPFAPKDQWHGYFEMIRELEDWLIESSGYDAISMQPNSGAQGEYAGLLAIRRYHESIGEAHRDVCLIPSSAHGTNPASASMMGLKVVVIKTDTDGNIDMEDLRNKIDQHADNLSSLMITYPSTHGVFEETVTEACDWIHAAGGKVYLDGANMNALVGLTSPGKIGADVSHMNLHKTFCIPHGGGGPGMGPIGVKSDLAPFVPSHSFFEEDGAMSFAVSAAPYGSAAILPISWSYIQMMGGEGLKKATQVAILSANYIAQKIGDDYDVLYRGRNGRVAHECIIDIRPIKESTGVTEEDIAKRMMDYGFHAPTMSWPVPGTIMVEPTESESKQELDRFCDALISIRNEIREIEKGNIAVEESPLRFAPHTIVDISDVQWDRKYSRKIAIGPAQGQLQNKFWPAVNRIDNVYGDRNFVCSCPPISEYEAE
ncbi:MAG: aminomethyl-transferring glycine dehydrogenase, partial [Planctomycetota bacterium]